MPFDAFLKIEGIEGESLDDKPKNEIDVISFHWGITNPERGRTRLSEFQIVKSIDVATPAIFDAVCSGDHIKEAQFILRKAGADQQEYFKIRMEEVLITSQIPAGSTGGDAVPMEQVSFNFAKVEVEYRQQDPKGGFGDWVKSSCSPRNRGT